MRGDVETAAVVQVVREELPRGRLEGRVLLQAHLPCYNLVLLEDAQGRVAAPLHVPEIVGPGIGIEGVPVVPDAVGENRAVANDQENLALLRRGEGVVGAAVVVPGAVAEPVCRLDIEEVLGSCLEADEVHGVVHLKGGEGDAPQLQPRGLPVVHDGVRGLVRVPGDGGGGVRDVDDLDARDPGACGVDDRVGGGGVDGADIRVGRSDRITVVHLQDAVRGHRPEGGGDCALPEAGATDSLGEADDLRGRLRRARHTDLHGGGVGILHADRDGVGFAVHLPVHEDLPPAEVEVREDHEGEGLWARGDVRAGNGDCPLARGRQRRGEVDSFDRVGRVEAPASNGVSLLEVPEEVPLVARAQRGCHQEV